MNQKHTPTPWEVHIPRNDIRTMFGGDTGIEILQPLPDPETGQRGGYQIVIGHVNCQHDKRILTKEDAEFICRAVNSHDELLATLEALLEDVEFAQPQIESGLIGNRQIKKARAAIAKAKGES